MMKTGLVSVTFRDKTSLEIIELVKKAGLDGIEWGSDVHVPNTAAAKEISQIMKEYGLDTISYGSYYRVGVSSNFEDVLEAAAALKTSNVRVWAGNIGSESANKEYRSRVVEDAKRIADLAAKEGIDISFEYHGDTLTDRQDSLIRLLDEINRDNVYSYWQPLPATTEKENIANVAELSGKRKLKNIHAYRWVGPEVRLLEDGKEIWKKYIDGSNAEAVLLEFVKDNSAESFYKDAETLKKLIK